MTMRWQWLEAPPLEEPYKMDFYIPTQTVCRKTRCRRLFSSLPAILFFCALILVSAPAASVAPDKIMVYFYSSETNVNNFKSLKMGFDRYLAEYGAYEFQPFEDREKFDKHVKDKERCLLLLSSWHYRNIAKDFGLKVALAGIRDGKKYHQRILVAGSTIPHIKSLKAGPIASASSLQHTRSVLLGMFKERHAAEGARILTVPKDIDALMSLGFGMSKAALTTRSAFEELRIVNPTLYKKMDIVAQGEESLLMLLAVPGNFVKASSEIVNVIKNMPMNPDGRNKMKMLGLDGWQEPDRSDRLKLEAK
jgi:hypothetical protein